jgi:hypothetical protein
MANFIKNISDSHPGKCKPLVKTHKPAPFPTRLLLSGCGTPVQPLSKLVQLAISHLTTYLPYQIIDSKEFLQKVMMINKTFPSLPQTAVFMVCDVISLYPNVDNAMGIPATNALLSQHPSPLGIPKPCILEALSLVLNNNSARYEDGQGNVILAKPNRGIAMGPSHACDFVDIFMGEIDERIVNGSPVPLVSSLAPPQVQEKLKYLDWSRFRDDAITILPDMSFAQGFEEHLQAASPPSINWTVTTTKEAEYLDVKAVIDQGKIKTDVFSKHCHSYLPPNSCHAPSVFKGLISGVGTRLRMICSEDQTLKERIEEYAEHFETSGWNKKHVLKELKRGADKDRDTLLNKPRKVKGKKLAWVTTFDPRVPDKTKIINKNLHLLYSNPENKKIFPKKSVIAADRRRKNLAEHYKPTVPRRFVQHGPKQDPGFHPCSAKRCDTCAHSLKINECVSPWDGRRWQIRKNLTCTSLNVIYIIRCKIHHEAVYVGSTKNLKLRWANHKSDVLLKKTQKCAVSQHMNARTHDLPLRQGEPLPSHLHEYLEIFAVDQVQEEASLLRKETWWQCNFGSLFVGLNARKDLNSMLRYNNRILYK